MCESSIPWSCSGVKLMNSVKVMPTAISTGGDIGLSNLSLKTITLSLYSKSYKMIRANDSNV